MMTPAQCGPGAPGRAKVNCYEAFGAADDRPYKYVLDRMYSVRFVVDRAGVIVERCSYSAHGKPSIKESAGRGDLWDFGALNSSDGARFAAAPAGPIWDARSDIRDNAARHEVELNMIQTR